MPTEQSRWRELAELMPDHILRDVDRDEFLPVVHRERVSHHLRRHRGAARPRLDHPSIGATIHDLDLFEEMSIDERSFFQ